MPDKQDKYLELIALLDKYTCHEDKPTNDKAADDYELSGAKDLLKGYLISKNISELDEAVRRLTRLFDRQKKEQRSWARAFLPKIRELAIEATTNKDRSISKINSFNAQVQAPAALKHGQDEAIDVLVMAALMTPELIAFIRLLDNVQERLADSRSILYGMTYIRGDLGKHNTETKGNNNLSIAAICQDRMGAVDAAILVTTAFNIFKPSVVAMTGVCAGRESAGVKLRDLIIPRQIITHDTGKHKNGIFEREPYVSEVSEIICRRIAIASDRILTDLKNQIKAKYPEDIYIPNIHTDVMACGASVISTDGFIDDIAKANRKIVGVDMESYGMIRAMNAISPTTPAFVIKSVMDLGKDKQDEVKERAAFWAASYLARFLSHEFDNIV